MAKTPLTGSSAYCTGAQLCVRYDVRTIARLISDSDTKVADGSVAGHATVAAILKDCSGKLEAACLLGGRYTPADLAALTTGNQAEFIAGIVADLAMQVLVRRRPGVVAGEIDGAKEAERLLNALANGERIFGFQEAADAGHLQSEVETPDIVETRSLPTFIARSFFGTRANRVEAE